MGAAGAPSHMPFDDLLNTWRAALTALIAGWGAPWSVAQELAQDALVEGYMTRDGFRGDLRDPQAAGPWLRGIARNLYFTHRRKLDRHRAEPLDPESCIDESALEIEEDPRLDEVRAAMREMPERLREVLYLRYLDATPTEEVAGLLGLSARAVEGRLRRARKHLERRLQERQEPSGRRPS